MRIQRKIRELTFLQDSFFVSFTESLNILSQTSRLFKMNSIKQSVQHPLESHWIFGQHSSGFASVYRAGALDAQEQCLDWGWDNTVPSSSFHLGGMTPSGQQWPNWWGWGQQQETWSKSSSQGSQTYQTVKLSLAWVPKCDLRLLSPSQTEAKVQLLIQFHHNFVT